MQENIKKLDRIQWEILSSLTDGDEPFEVVDGCVEDYDPSVTPDQVLLVLLDLYKQGFLTIKQVPMTAFKQEFSKKNIRPRSHPREILGDVYSDYEEYCKKRDYLWKVRLGSNDEEPAGVPFGIWFDMTDKGRNECDKPVYRDYYEDTNA